MTPLDNLKHHAEKHGERLMKTSPEAVGATPKERAEKLAEKAAQEVKWQLLAIIPSSEHLSNDCNRQIATTILRETNLVELLERIDELQTFLRNREASLKRAGEDWVRAKEETDQVKAELDRVKQLLPELNAVAKAADARSHVCDRFVVDCDCLICKERLALTALREKGWKPE